jgi:hypothetical protein
MACNGCALPSYFSSSYNNFGVSVVQFVEALRYKLEGRGFYSRCVTGIVHYKKPAGRTMAPVSTRNEYLVYPLGGA